MTSKIEALSMSPYAKQWVDNTTSVTTLHKFSVVHNLINQSNEVISFVNQIIGNGPFNIVIPSMKINSNSTITIERNTVYINKSELLLEDVTIWNPKPKWEQLKDNSGALTTATDIIFNALKDQAPFESFADISNKIETSTNINDYLLKIADKAIRLLTKSIAPLNFATLAEASRQLAGLGAGLTPAGDDYLIGFMHGVWSVFPQDEAHTITKIMNQATKLRTTTLSAAWLKSASAGEAGESWHTLINSIARVQKGNILSATKNIISTGHTSGADALAGYLQAVRCLS